MKMVDQIQIINSLLGNYKKLISDKENISSLLISKELKDLAYNELQVKCEKYKRDLLHRISELPEICVVPIKEDNKIETLVENITPKNKDEKIKKSENPVYIWKQSLSDKVNYIYYRKIKYTTGKEIFHEIYEYMTNVYGVVWEQDFKEWRRNHNGIPRTLDIIYNNKQYKSIFESVLEDKYNATKENHPDLLTIKELITPLVEKTNDKSKGGCVTVRKIYALMESKYNVKWDKQMRKYNKENNTETCKKCDLLYWNRGNIERFRDCIEDLMND